MLSNVLGAPSLVGLLLLAAPDIPCAVARMPLRRGLHALALRTVNLRTVTPRTVTLRTVDAIV